MIFDVKEDCPPVEAFIWDMVSTDWEEFTGICKFSKSDLNCLKSFIEMQLAMKE